MGTAAAANGGVGGLPVAPIHSGIFVPAVPVGGSPIFSTSTSPSNGRDPSPKKGRASVVVKAKHNVSVIAPKTRHNVKAPLVKSNHHPRGPAHR